MESAQHVERLEGGAHRQRGRLSEKDTTYPDRPTHHCEISRDLVEFSWDPAAALWPSTELQRL